MQQWRSQLPDLVNAYLTFTANGAKKTESKAPGTWNLQVINFERKYLILFLILPRTCH